MKNITRKYISFLLSITMILSCFNGFLVTAYAESGEVTEEVVNEQLVEEVAAETEEESQGDSEEVIDEEPAEEPAESSEAIEETQEEQLEESLEEVQQEPSKEVSEEALPEEQTAEEPEEQTEQPAEEIQDEEPAAPAETEQPVSEEETEEAVEENLPLLKSAAPMLLGAKNRIDISNGYYVEINKSFTYTGNTLTITENDVSVYTEVTKWFVFVPYTEKEYLDTTDFTLSGTISATNAGIYTCTIEGNGNYTGRLSVDWTIKAKDLSKADVTISGASFTFDNKSHGPSVVSVVLNGETLLNTDYYTDGDVCETNANTKNWKGEYNSYELKIKGCGNYSGTIEKAWNILPRDLSDAVVEIETVLYEKYETALGELIPSIQTPTVKVYLDGNELKQGDDFTLSGEKSESSSGKYTLFITGKGNYTGTVPKDWKIIKKINLKVGESKWIEEFPTYYKFESSNTNVAAVENRDALKNAYIVAKSPGNAVITQSGIKTGKETYYEVIVDSLPLTECRVSTSPSKLVYNGSEQSVDITVKAEGKTLAPGTDYTVSGTISATNAGKYNVTVSGINNYSGDVKTSWEIEKYPLLLANVTLEHDSLSYNGSVQSVGAVTVKVGNTTLTEGVDYTVSGNKSSDVGTHYVKITATEGGNYTGSTYKNWEISYNYLQGLEINWGETSFIYDENTAVDGYTVDPIVTVGGVRLKAGQDYIFTAGKKHEPGVYEAGIYQKAGSGYVFVLPIKKIWDVCEQIDLTYGDSEDLGYWGYDLELNDNWSILEGDEYISLNRTSERYDAKAKVTAKNVGTAKIEQSVGLVPYKRYYVNVVPAELDAIITVSPASFVYDGTMHIPQFVVETSGGIKYIKNEDYKVTGQTSATEAGIYTVTVSGINNYTGEIGFSWEITKPAAKPVHYSSGSSSQPTVNVPVSGNEGSVKISGKVSQNTMTVKDFELGTAEQVLGEEVSTGMLTFDIAAADKNVDSVVMPASLIEKISDAIQDENNDVEGFTVEFGCGSVSFDKQAALTIAEQVPADSSIELKVDDSSALSSEPQKEAVKDLNAQVVLDIYLVENNRRISDFGGGKATIRIPYELKDGQTAEGLSVWYVAEDGSKEAVQFTYLNGVVEATLFHFSNYVIAWNAECLRDESCPASKFSDVDVLSWYHDGVHFCVESGYMIGYKDDTFRPDAIETKAQLAAVLYRIAQGMGKGFTGDWAFRLDAVDAADIPEYAFEGSCWLYMNGVLETDGDGFLNINEGLTREEFVNILYKFAIVMGFDMDAFSDESFPATAWADAEAILDDEKFKLSVMEKVCRGEGASAIQAFLASCVK